MAEATSLSCNESLSSVPSTELPFVLSSSGALLLAAAEQPVAEPNNSSLKAAFTFAVVSQTTETGMELVDVGVCGGILMIFVISFLAQNEWLNKNNICILRLYFCLIDGANTTN